jgi:hypothetical protein
MSARYNCRLKLSTRCLYRSLIYKEFETQTNNLDSYNSTRPVSETLSDSDSDASNDAIRLVK